jgi:hypothetical protein
VLFPEFATCKKKETKPGGFVSFVAGVFARKHALFRF